MTDSLKVEISYKQIWKIALPIALALLVPQLNLLINSIFLGHHSEQSLAIGALTGVYYLIFAGIGFGLNNGLQTLISRRAGEERPEEIGKLFTQGVYIGMLIAVTGILITLFITPPILKLFLTTEQADQSIDFLRIRILGLPFLYVYQLRNALLVGINKSKYLIAGTLAETIANIFFDYTLIFGKWGFPEMGFNGAAVASIIAEFTGMVVIFWVISKKGIAKKFSLFTKFKLDKVNARLIIKISGPLAFQHAASILAWFFFYMLVARNASQTGLAVSTTMRNVFGFGILSHRSPHAQTIIWKCFYDVRLKSNYVAEVLSPWAQLPNPQAFQIVLWPKLIFRLFLPPFLISHKHSSNAN
ncbi:MAG: MATE family efflux transporter, partial [Flavisolibacter sp.]